MTNRIKIEKYPNLYWEIEKIEKHTMLMCLYFKIKTGTLSVDIMCIEYDSKKKTCDVTIMFKEISCFHINITPSDIMSNYIELVVKYVKEAILEVNEK